MQYDETRRSGPRQTGAGTPMATDASRCATRRPARPKWHYLYFVLAAFDLFAVCAGLYLTREITTIYTHSVAVNQLWSERAAEYSRLGELASAVNAPGNDVFDTRDVDGESAKMRAVLTVFERQIIALRAALAEGAAPDQAGPLLAHLDRVSAAMAQMVDEANLIFAYFDAGRPGLAGERMATMDRKFATLNTALAQLRAAVSDIQRENFVHQIAAAKDLHNYEYGIGMLILVMVAGATLYGHRIARQVQAHADEEERHYHALGEAEARTRSILDTAPDGIVAFDAQGRIETFSQAAVRLFGCAAGAAIGRDVRVLMAGDGAQRFAALLADPGPEAAGFFDNIDCRRAGGTMFPAEIAVRAMPLCGHRRFVCVIRDITERRLAERALCEERDRLQELNGKFEEAQNQLLQSEKMASIGQLAAGVAHEINNPVGFIGSNVRTLQTYVRDLLAVLTAYESAVDPILDAYPERRQPVVQAKAAADLAYVSEDLPRLLEETQDGVARVRRIVQDLKEFSHSGVREAQFADLHKGLDSTLNVVWNELKYKARVVKEYGALPPVECILSQINQVFMNLLVNAAHAIESQGTITLRSGEQGGMAWVEVEDTGAGIPPQNLKRLFEPFFTTKPVGQGTGLGLSLCYSIVKKHGGRIEVRSEVGKGTAFRLWLPVKMPAALAEGACVEAA